MKNNRKSKSIYNIGLRAHQSGDLDHAASLYAQVLNMEEPDALALRLTLNNLAALYIEKGEYEQAGELFCRLLEMDPEDVAGLNGMGLVIQSKRDWNGAIAFFNRAIMSAPDRADLYSNLGICLTSAGRFDEARIALQQAIQHLPNATGFFNLGRLHENTGNLAEALSCYDQALLSDRDMFVALLQRGLIYHAMGKDTAAIMDLERALTIDPSSAKAAWNLSICLLSDGRYEEGWRLFEARWQGHGGMAAAKRRFAVGQWDGACDPKGRLLIHTEQGIGDALQMARYIPLAKQAFQGEVVVEAQASLVRLLKNSFATQDIRIVERASDFPGGAGLPPFTTHVPLLSLPGLFETQLTSIPNLVPYLHPSPDLRHDWGKRITAARGTLRVGLVWRGNPQHYNDMNRSIPAAALEPLLSVPKVSWFLLQKHMVPATADMLSDRPGVTDLGPLLDDFADTAAALTHLDLVISVDTSVLHLAGACKRPTWALLGWPNDWRWLRERNSSPWYPTMTLFRQRQSGDWAPVIDQVERKLRLLTSL
ncbi:tetratricopeptide repeat protein [Niveispirillum irakense]|uniref:tetratricopeptide repeat-containing glycosyltransferase family protein n=1 Tax=Niveispirillum irakense TaxID=34011 RepID=UPI001378DF65|nr:tetratricopeptide repeat-containing glycosyltransferase family protein [Niveispirillum irakense]